MFVLLVLLLVLVLVVLFRVVGVGATAGVGVGILVGSVRLLVAVSVLGVTAGVGCAAVVDGGIGRDKGTGWVSGLLYTRYTAVAVSGWCALLCVRHRVRSLGRPPPFTVPARRVSASPFSKHAVVLSWSCFVLEPCHEGLVLSGPKFSE